MPSSRSMVALWLAATLLCLANGQQVGTSCPQPRIRKSWDSYTAAEKALYTEAVGVAMDRGFHQKFVQIHTEQLTGLEAHQSCVFIYWHRMLLLGYENMLCSLNTAYQCITLPYWDHLSGSARQANNNCSSIEECSSIIADFGGTTTGYPQLDQDGLRDSRPAYHFCGNNTGCAHCILRTRSKYLSATTYPNEASFGSVYQQVLTYSDSGSFTSAVERGIHNTIHNALGRVMTYLQAPVDPMFYSHHSLIDLLQTIYLKCQIGDEKAFLSAENKSSDPRVWTSCTRSNGGNFRGSDNITMRALANDGKTYVNVWQDPNNVLYPFFKDMPYQYADYVDAKDLKGYSYTYDISGGLANMYQNCKDSNTFSAISLLADSQQATKKKNPLLPTISEGTEEDDAVRLWHIALFEAAQIVGFQDWAARDQMEMIACVHHGECIGPIDDYTNLFRTNFGVTGHTRCFSILQDIMEGTRIIGIPMWREITSRFLPCPLQEEDGSDSEGGSEAAVA
ncbi:hypothetical protein PHYSODRAFT_301135 [Phytophthora sojae]|uniref:Tyrosinase copper-binding domain-containing protein n=1 Tax=Phytophthora sojae (strain P6497) TaxID=1094619 RepID=G4ZF58_PHYSP|nr:hypothetical protein PHYSODRAFT_301135 [Phytophthora sojae]EGZ18489.1 hypothetical protein PHYSODRAFT_301135 [Phytophthora sojae]|eukprot:XP_009527547.1 hypothetical protein PHYSODRAFT_301135 [Phytophthora sojae]